MAFTMVLTDEEGKKIFHIKVEAIAKDSRA